MHRETRVFKRKEVTEFWHNEWKDSSWMWSIREVVTVHKNVLSPRMTVKITNKSEVSLTIERTYQLFDCRVFRMKDFRWILPPTIKVLSAQWTTIIAINNSIWIKHWYYFEDKVVPERLRLWCIAHQKVDNTFHHPTCITFTRVHTSTNEDTLFSLCFLIVGILVFWCNCKVFTSITRQSPTKSTSIYEILWEPIAFNPC